MMSSCLYCSDYSRQRPAVLGLGSIGLWCLVVVTLVATGIAVPRSSVAQLVEPPSTDLLEDRPEKLTPKHPRSEADEDRLVAAAQFAHGRMLLQREKTAEALARFERSFRNEPSVMVAKEVMAAASELGRHAEAVRYAILSAELHASDGDFSIRLAAFLTERGDHSRAAKVLENALQATKPATGLNLVLLRCELMRLYLVMGQAESAAKAADSVRESLDQRERAGLTESDHKKLVAQRERLDALIGESYFRMQRYADAESIYRSMHKARPNEGLLGFQLARMAVEQKDWKSARERLEAYFREKLTASGFEPYEVLERIVVAEVADENRAQATVLAELRKLREHDPGNNALAYFTAEKLLAANELEAAGELYEELLKRQATATAYRQLAQIFRRQKNATALLKLVAQSVDQANSRELFGAEAEAIVKDAPLFEQLVALVKQPGHKPGSQSSAGPLVGVSLLALKGGKVELARELYLNALAVPGADPTKVRETVGMMALLSEQHGLAADVFEQAIASKPPNDKLAAYYYYLAGAREFAGETQKAMAAAEKCVVLNRDSAQFHSRPAWVLYHSKQWDEAERRYRELLTRFDMKYESEEVRDQMRQARLILSNICVLQKRIPEAEEWLEQVLDEFPEHIGALNDLGYLWADQGKRLQRSLQMVETAVERDPDNAAYRDSLGWTYYRLGRYSDAVRELERAVAAAPDGVIYDHLGDAYLKLDDRAKAVESWRKGFDLMDSATEAAERALVTDKIKRYSETKN